ncbi:MAG: glycosyltransferase family 4 protein [Gemmatimonadota bacterium]
MKVAYLCSLKRGLPVFTYREIRSLRDLGVDVSIYVMRDVKRQGDALAVPESDWPVVKLKLFPFLLRHITTLLRTPRPYLSTLVVSIQENLLPHFAQAVYFAKEMRDAEIDLVYCFEGKHAVWVAHFIREWYRVPTTVIVHADVLTIEKRVKFTKTALGECARIITVSMHNRDALVERFGISPDRIEIVRLWSPYRPDDRIKVLIVGEWSERKGHETLLDAFARLDPSRYVLWVVGGGSWDGDFYDVAEETGRRGLRDRVIIWGRVPEEFLKVLYSSADVFALPSRTTRAGVTEGIPVALMEAMSFRLPVVSTNHTGIPELVEEILVPENDAAALRDALASLGESKELRRRLGDRNREIVCDRFSEGNVRHIKDIFEQVLGDAEGS